MHGTIRAVSSAAAASPIDKGVLPTRMRAVELAHLDMVERDGRFPLDAADARRTADA
jgi:hypothetical protein